MIRKEDVKKMLVSDDGKEWTEKYTLFESAYGCYAVNKSTEAIFEAGGDFFIVIRRNYCKPIPEKKKRPMTRNEVLKFVLANHNRILIAHKDNSWSCVGANSFEKPNEYEYIFIDELGTDHETPKKFEIEED